MSTPYGGNDPQQWGQQPPPGPPSGGVPGQPGYGQPGQPGQYPGQQPQPGYPQQPGYGQPQGYPPAQTPPPGQPMPQQPGPYTQPGQPPQAGGHGTASYTQPGGQPPPPGYPHQPGQAPPPGQPYGPPPGMGAAGPAPQKKKSGKGMWIGLAAAVVLVAAAAVVLFWIPGFLVQKVFDTEAMNQDVQRVLTDNYGVQGVQGVTCPEDQAVAVDESFTCDVSVEGETRQVTITVKSEDGRYQVGRLQ